MDYNEIKSLLIKLRKLSKYETIFPTAINIVYDFLCKSYRNHHIDDEEYEDLLSKFKSISNSGIDEDLKKVESAYARVMAHKNSGAPLFYDNVEFSDLLKLRDICIKFNNMVNVNNYRNICSDEITKIAIESTFSDCKNLENVDRDKFFYSLRNLERLLTCAVTRLSSEWDLDFSEQIDYFYEKEKEDLEYLNNFKSESIGTSKIRTSNSFSGNIICDLTSKSDSIILDLKRTFMKNPFKLSSEMEKSFKEIDSMNIDQDNKYDLKDIIKTYMSKYGVYKPKDVIFSILYDDIICMVPYNKDLLEKSIEISNYIVNNTNFKILYQYCKIDVDRTVHSQKFAALPNKKDFYLSLIYNYIKLMRYHKIIDDELESELKTKELQLANELFYEEEV